MKRESSFDDLRAQQSRKRTESFVVSDSYGVSSLFFK